MFEAEDLSPVSADRESGGHDDLSTTGCKCQGRSIVGVGAGVGTGGEVVAGNNWVLSRDSTKYVHVSSNTTSNHHRTPSSISHRLSRSIVVPLVRYCLSILVPRIFDRRAFIMLRLRSRRVFKGSSCSTSRANRKRKPVDNDDDADSNPPSHHEEDANPPSNPEEDMLLCQNCFTGIPHTADHALIQPCEHTLCNFCSIKSLYDRGCNPHKCPVDNCGCISTRFQFVRGQNGDSTTIYNPYPEEHFIANVPVYRLGKQHRDLIFESEDNEGIAISCYKVRKTNGGSLNVKHCTATFVLLNKEDEKTNEPVKVYDQTRALEEVGNVFTSMHSPIAKASMDFITDPPVLSPRELLEMRVQGPRMLDRALYAISTGYKKFDKPTFLAASEQDQRKMYLAAIISADILLRFLRGNPGSPGFFQLMFGELLRRQRLTQDFSNLCSILSLAPSIKHQLKAGAEKTLEQLRQGIRVKARDLVLLFFDNIGFKVIGRQASYDQWILMNIVVVPEKELMQAGFYRDDAGDTDRISREPTCVWKDTIDDISTDEEKTQLARSVVGIQDLDFDRLSECVLENIRFALVNLPKLSLDNQQQDKDLPRFDRIVSIETSNAMDTKFASRNDRQNNVVDEGEGTIHRNSAIIPRLNFTDDHDTADTMLGGNDVFRPVDNAGTVTIDEDNEDESEQAENRRSVSNMYINNHNAKMEVHHMDLSAKTSLIAMCDYLLSSNTKQNEQWKDEKIKYGETAEPPLAEIMIGCGCDGQPAVAMRRILAADAQSGSGRLYPESFFFSFGGMHTVMKALNASGEYFQELLKDVWSAFRDTWEKVQWILFPSDPGQREVEYSWCLLAHYAVAAINLRQHKGMDVSAVEVNGFMLQRAKEYPLCAMVLLEIRVGTILKLMHNSEKIGKRGSVSMFLTAIRLIMPLFAVTHKTDYMFLCQDLLKWYYCASPALRKIYDEFIFTQVTSNHQPIFHDCFVEKSVMHVRKRNGKKHYRGIDLAMEMAAANIPISNGRRTEGCDINNSETTAQSRRQKTHIELVSTSVCPYYKVAEKYNDMKIWSPDEAPVIRGTSVDKSVECNKQTLDVPGGGVLHSQILSAITDLGRDRTTQYFIEYYINNYGEATRSESTVSLAKINLTVDGIKTKLNQAKILWTSTNANEFQPAAFTKARLVKHIEMMAMLERERSPDQQVQIDHAVIPKLRGKNKTFIVNFMIEWRSKSFEKNPQLKEELTKQIEEEFANNGMSTPEQRGVILEDTLFQLSESIRENERYTTPIAVVNDT